MMIEYEEKYETLDYSLEVEKFREKFNLEIPSEYVAFLSRYGAGLFPDPSFFCGWPVDIVYQFYGDNYGNESAIDETETFIRNGRISKNILVFASTADGHTTYCLILNGILSGAVAAISDDNMILSEHYKESDVGSDFIIAKGINEFFGGI